MSENWNLIRTLHSSVDNIPPAIVDLIAVLDILSLCVRGKSTTAISDSLDMDIKYIESVLLEYFDFPGWNENIPINLFSIYKATKYDFDKFYSAVSKFTDKNIDITFCYKICFMYYMFKKELERYGYG